MGIVLALLSALFTGSTSVIATKLKGTPTQQSLGVTLGAFIFGVLTCACFVLPRTGGSFAFDSHIWIVGLCSGLFWSVGQVGQYSALRPLGVSVALPISTAGQVVGNALLGAIVLGEWTSVRVWIIGVVAIILISAGAICTSVQPKRATAQMVVEGAGDGVQAGEMVNSMQYRRISHDQFRRGLIYIGISTLGYMLFFIFPNFMHKIGYISDALFNAPSGNGLYYMTAIVLPQSIGQVAGVLIIMTLLRNAKSGKFFAPATFRNIITGLMWAAGNVCVFIACASPSAGQAVATTLSQLGVIVATFGGIVVLHERKTARQMRFIVLGCVLLAVGAVLMGLYTTK